MVDRQRSWILDGHNMIFALPQLAALQEGGEKARARDQLEALLLPFAAARGFLTVVYDGNRLPPDPDARETPYLRVVFSHPPQDADDRIVELATRDNLRGLQVTVVTNDRRSLIPRLPQGVDTLGIETFHRRLVGRRPAAAEADEKRFSPAEAEALAAEVLARTASAGSASAGELRRREQAAHEQWLTRSGHRLPGTEQTPPVRRRPADRLASQRTAHASPQPRRSAPGAGGRASPTHDSREQRSATTDRETHERKRERGLRRQRRRLAQLERSRSQDARRRKARRKGWR
ncbi:MAG: NYN domain-containing protein [Candidatus Eisenbacteria sp.]|nr:NYN domain-containing protein [Candidatus Eisenbacteria bacterium]